MASDASVSELAPPGTKVAIGINVRGLLDSSLVKDLAGKDMDAATKLASSGMFRGLDPLKDVDRILIFSTAAGEKAPTLIVVRGRFNLEQLAQGAKRYHDIPVLEDEKTPDGAIALIDSETVIGGEPAQVQAAIDRRGSGAKLNAEFLSRIDAVEPQYLFWGIGDCPDGLQAPGEAAEALRSIDSFFFGAALREGLELTAEIHARSAEDAAKMTAALGMIQMALQAQQPKDSGTKFDMRSDNGTFRISLTVPQEDLRKAIESQRAMLASAVATQLKGESSKPTFSVSAEPGMVMAPVTTTPTVVAHPSTPAALEAISQPVLSAPGMPAQAAASAPPVPAAPKPASPPATKTEIIKAPDGDTVIVKLPGGN